MVALIVSGEAACVELVEQFRFKDWRVLPIGFGWVAWREAVH
jgi:hypothetical protein